MFICVCAGQAEASGQHSPADHATADTAVSSTQPALVKAATAAAAGSARAGGAILYTLGHGATTQDESSDSEDDEEQIASRVQRQADASAADALALAAWFAKLGAAANGGGAGDSVGNAVVIGGLIDVRSADELATMPDSTHGPAAVESLCAQHGIVYKRLPALAPPAAAGMDGGDSKRNSSKKKWLGGVGAVASLKHCVGLARRGETSWGLLGVAQDWQSCHRAYVADALCQLGGHDSSSDSGSDSELQVWHVATGGGLEAHRSSDTTGRSHGRGGLGGRRGASLVDGGAAAGAQKKGGKAGAKGSGGGGGGSGGWQPAGLESQALAVHLGVDAAGGQRKGAGGGGKKSRRSIILDSVAIVFHHLLDETKREWIMQWARCDQTKHTIATRMCLSTTNQYAQTQRSSVTITISCREEELSGLSLPLVLESRLVVSMTNVLCCAVLYCVRMCVCTCVGTRAASWSWADCLSLGTPGS